MKKLFFLALGLAASCTAQAVEIGDSYADVIAEKGTPGGEMNARGLKILVYPEVTIKLKADKVVSLEAPKDAVVAPDAPAAESVSPQAGGRFRSAVWTTNYEDALKQARDENRHVFMFFTGSDWCGWCHRLRDEVLSTPEFQAYAREKLILLELDFPRKKSQPAKLKEQNSKLAGKYGIRGYPTVVLLNSRGKQIDSLGYQRGGPGPYIERLRNQ